MLKLKLGIGLNGFNGNGMGLDWIGRLGHNTLWARQPQEDWFWLFCFYLNLNRPNIFRISRTERNRVRCEFMLTAFKSAQV